MVMIRLKLQIIAVHFNKSIISHELPSHTL